MKPAPFSYIAPTSLEEALAALDQHGYDAKLLAGGQSLIPVMNFRLAQPAVIVDLNGVSELGHLLRNEAGGLRLGAMVRQRMLELDETIAALYAPLAYASVVIISRWVGMREDYTRAKAVLKVPRTLAFPELAV